MTSGTHKRCLYEYQTYLNCQNIEKRTREVQEYAVSVHFLGILACPKMV